MKMTLVRIRLIVLSNTYFLRLQVQLVCLQGYDF